ncbi:MAG: hypothetical protein BJ554DRAFT_4299, partial [Olpidium bornovanus]
PRKPAEPGDGRTPRPPEQNVSRTSRDRPTLSQPHLSRQTWLRRSTGTHVRHPKPPPSPADGPDVGPPRHPVRPSRAVPGRRPKSVNVSAWFVLPLPAETPPAPVGGRQVNFEALLLPQMSTMNYVPVLSSPAGRRIAPPPPPPLPGQPPPQPEIGEAGPEKQAVVSKYRVFDPPEGHRHDALRWCKQAHWRRIRQWRGLSQQHQQQQQQQQRTGAAGGDGGGGGPEQQRPQRKQQTKPCLRGSAHTCQVHRAAAAAACAPCGTVNGEAGAARFRAKSAGETAVRSVRRPSRSAGAAAAAPDPAACGPGTAAAGPEVGPSRVPAAGKEGAAELARSVGERSALRVAHAAGLCSLRDQGPLRRATRPPRPPAHGLHPARRRRQGRRGGAPREAEEVPVASSSGIRSRRARGVAARGAGRGRSRRTGRGRCAAAARRPRVRAGKRPGSTAVVRSVVGLRPAGAVAQFPAAGSPGGPAARGGPA